MTNRQAYEEAAGYGLDDIFFRFYGIDPNAEYVEVKCELTTCQLNTGKGDYQRESI